MPKNFVMTLANNDVSGQRGEGYVLVPLAARKKKPGFWGWTAEFEQGDTYLERAVTVIDGGRKTASRIYHQDTKNEFRLATDLYFSGASSDAILVVSREPKPGVDFSYRFIEPNEDDYGDVKAHAKDWATSGNKRFGYF
jgi:hypothetical protein